jgi:hypothetical protein
VQQIRVYTDGRPPETVGWWRGWNRFLFLSFGFILVVIFCVMICGTKFFVPR